MNLNRIAIAWRRAIPEVRQLELTRRVWKCRVKNQADGEKQIALPDAVFSQQNDVPRERDLDRPEISEIANAQLA
jgi:hypothetical protein